jgi:hypothetical protein
MSRRNIPPNLDTRESVVADLPHLVTDELESIAVSLESQFPEFAVGDIRDLVYETYGGLACDARIEAHLIPLTMNRARAVLEADRAKLQEVNS